VIRAYPAILLGPLAEGKVVLIAGSGILGLVSRETESNGRMLIRAVKSNEHTVGPWFLRGRGFCYHSQGARDCKILSYPRNEKEP
jgi:hypothetical protein